MARGHAGMACIPGLQAVFRKWWRNKQLALAECATWDRRIGDLDKLAAAFALQGRSFVPPAAGTMELTRSVLSFAKFIKPVDAAVRLTRLCTMLRASAQSDNLKTNVCAAVLSPSEHLPFLFKVL